MGFCDGAEDYEMSTVQYLGSTQSRPAGCTALTWPSGCAAGEEATGSVLPVMQEFAAETDAITTT